MSIVERVDASVDFKFPDRRGACTIKQLEEYIFNARMRGAEEDSVVTFTKAGATYDTYVSGMSVTVPATMGGFPVVPTEQKSLSTRTKAQAIAVGGIVAVLGFLAAIIAIILAVV